MREGWCRVHGWPPVPSISRRRSSISLACSTQMFFNSNSRADLMERPRRKNWIRAGCVRTKHTPPPKNRLTPCQILPCHLEKKIIKFDMWETFTRRPKKIQTNEKNGCRKSAPCQICLLKRADVKLREPWLLRTLKPNPAPQAVLLLQSPSQNVVSRRPWSRGYKRMGKGIKANI